MSSDGFSRPWRLPVLAEGQGSRYYVPRILARLVLFSASPLSPRSHRPRERLQQHLGANTGFKGIHKARTCCVVEADARGVSKPGSATGDVGRRIG